MFGKHFESMYTGSMCGAGAVVFAVWGYVICHARKNLVELNPKFIGLVLGCSATEIVTAIDYLSQPDPHSRSQEHDGRRLVQQGTFLYLVPTCEKHRAIRDEDARRDYQKTLMRERRKPRTQQEDTKVLAAVSRGEPPLAHPDPDPDPDPESEDIRAKTKTADDPTNITSSPIRPPVIPDHERLGMLRRHRAFMREDSDKAAWLGLGRDFGHTPVLMAVVALNHARGGDAIYPSEIQEALEAEAAAVPEQTTAVDADLEAVFRLTQEGRWKAISDTIGLAAISREGFMELVAQNRPALREILTKFGTKGAA